MTFGAASLSEILNAQIYLGNLTAAVSVEQRDKLGITHVVSVCPEYPSTGVNHLTIAIDDSEYDDLLIHLPRACEFIQSALDQNGKVLVHCVMGISRSTTVVAAYLMKTRGLSAPAAIQFVKKRRPQVHPNYGFIQQLHTFAACQYAPSPTHAVYIGWRRRQEQDVTNFLNQMVDTTSIIPDRLLLSSDFPEDPEQAESLLLDLGITHVLSLSPAQLSSVVVASITKHRHINLAPYHLQEELLVALPDACEFIREAIDGGGQVLVHCLIESRACTVVCAYLMASRKIPPGEAYAVLEDALPLFNPTRSFTHHLELFSNCAYSPTASHPLVREWVSSGASQSAAGPRGFSDVRNTAAQLLSETGFDLSSFGDALVAIQKAGVVRS